MRNFASVATENGFVLPNYRNSNLSVLKNIVDGKKGRKAGEKEKTIFLLIDGLGYGMMDNLITDCKSNPLLADSRLERISTVYPSTTVSAITSFETGLTPAEHGMVGWDVYSKEHGMVLTPFRDMAAISRDFKLSAAGVRNIRPAPKLFMKAAERGRILLLHETPIGKTYEMLPNFDCDSYEVTHDLMIKLRSAVEKGNHNFIYAYYGMLDTLEHTYGPSSEEVRRAAAAIFSEIGGRLLPSIKKSGYNLVITADHGQIDTRKLIEINGKSKVMDYLAGPPWGDARIRFMNAADGKEDMLTRHFEEEYGDSMLLVESEPLIRTGIFGKKEVPEGLRYRFGTHIALAKGRNAIGYEYPCSMPTVYFKKGSHSGLSKDEMEVPLIVY
jgi:predicted AlkP superfamily pyrophosphatase or phosphodiesterase